MHAPRHFMPYRDRLLDCEEALEDSFLEVIDDAYECGWNAAEVAAALTNLADNLILMLMANEQTVRKIVEIKFRPH